MEIAYKRCAVTQRTIPSIQGIEQALAGHTSLRVVDRSSFGDHYRASLALWRARSTRNWPSVAQLGFDETFRRTWGLYLAFSEAGFAAGYLDVHQFLIARQSHGPTVSAGR